MATAVLGVVEARNPHSFRRYRTVLDAARAGDNPLLVAGRLLRADDDLMGHRGIDVFGLGWRALSPGDRAVTESLVSRKSGSAGRENWSDRDWGVVDQARRLGQARGLGEQVAQAVIKKMVTGQDPLVSLRASLYEASSGDDAVTRLDRADAALRAMGVNDQDVYHLPWKHWLHEQEIEAFAARLAGSRNMGKWEEPEWDAVAAAHRAGEAVAAATIKKVLIARNRDEFTSFRGYVAAAHANESPAVAAKKFLSAPKGLWGSDVYSLDWMALPASQKAVTRTLVSRWIKPRHIEHWTEKDWGTVAEASRSGEAFAAAVIKRLVTVTSRRNHELFADYHKALSIAKFESFEGDNAEAAFLVMQAADRLRNKAVDILSLEWEDLSVREQDEIKTLVRDSLPGGLFARSTAGWTAREWGVVAVVRKEVGQDVAAAAAQRLARSPQPQEWSGQRGPAGGLRV
ncbi:hypothetical protein PV350_46370, partial [Streptomyces sp. PA03-6a]|nr:hypothetical protein [Streptomyces sp. PA03-6a]